MHSRPGYHEAELEIASSPSDKRHGLPPRMAGRVLDVGCGAGQSLIALYPDRQTFGADVDLDALRLGRTWTTAVSFTCASAEQLPYADESFEHVFSRLALPYTDLRRSLSEVYRVLKPGGTVWLMLHSFQIPLRLALRNRSLNGWLYFSYVTVNGILFHVFGSLLCVLGRMESFQTTTSVTRAMRKAGFEAITVSREEHFVVTARKPGNPEAN